MATTNHCHYHYHDDDDHDNDDYDYYHYHYYYYKLAGRYERIHVSSMVSSENLVFDSLAKPSRNNQAFRGTYCTGRHAHSLQELVL